MNSSLASLRRTLLGSNHRLLISLLASGALIASVASFASGPVNVLRVYVQFEAPGISNYNHPVPGAVVKVTPPCNQASAVTDSNGLAFFTGCQLESTELVTQVVSYPANYRSLECPAAKERCEPRHTAEMRANHPGDDVFTLQKTEVSTPVFGITPITPAPSPAPNTPTDYGYRQPAAAAQAAGAPKAPAQAPQAGGHSTPLKSGTGTATSPAAPKPTQPQASASPTASPPAQVAAIRQPPKAKAVIAAASHNPSFGAGLIAVVLLLTLAVVLLVRAGIHHRRGRQAPSA